MYGGLLVAVVSYSASIVGGVNNTMAGQAGTFTVQAMDDYGNAYWASPSTSFRPLVRLSAARTDWSLMHPVSK
jgi:hypothetical protein